MLGHRHEHRQDQGERGGEAIRGSTIRGPLRNERGDPLPDRTHTVRQSSRGLGSEARARDAGLLGMKDPFERLTKLGYPAAIAIELVRVARGPRALSNHEFARWLLIERGAVRTSAGGSTRLPNPADPTSPRIPTASVSSRRS